MSGKMDSLTQFSENSEKSMQIKVPVVATVIEKVKNGQISFIVEPPGPDQDQGIFI